MIAAIISAICISLVFIVYIAITVINKQSSEWFSNNE
ncbi:hypothetical protein SAMN05444266_105313 [Chitinophaga jiangningensis]|uniref:Uncharacterized protein n=1 Tax=Chitinophaga jiangningensis TaxID=1419482 RepID=A0A1M7E7B0_9BACT|nr:hypothetical protein SAMN05444266_105313 [Chitinophaga jiangningensis]